MKYRATFIGCTKGAIGVTYRIETTTEGETPHDAELALYERFEHIAGLRLVPLADVEEG